MMRRLVNGLTLGIALGAGFSPFFTPVAMAARVDLPQKTYQAADWNLSWRAFLGAGAVDDAYRLALSATRARPQSKLWWRRLARAALWSNRPETALKAFYYLAIDLHDRSYLRQALNLALGLNDYGSAIVLLKKLLHLGKASTAQRRMLTSLYLDVGEPGQALAELKREYAHHPVPELLWEQAVIHRILGQPDREREVFEQYRRIYGPTPRVMLSLATIDFVHGYLRRALSALIAARSRAKPDDASYWQTLSNLAWMLGRYRLATQAARVLIDSEHANATIYLHAVYIDQYTHPRRAFEIAARGWKRTHNLALFLNMLGIASSMQPALPWLRKAFALLTPQQKRLFADNAFFWSSLALYREGKGQVSRAMTAYRQALKLSPGEDLFANYLWFLLDTHRLATIKPRLWALDEMAKHSPALWGVMAAIHAAFDQPEQAIVFLSRQWPTHHTRPRWLLNLADLYDQADEPDRAWIARSLAYDQLLARPDQPSHELTLDHLALHLTPGDVALAHISRRVNRPQEKQIRTLVLSWIFDNDAIALARWWRWRAYIGKPLPGWAALSIAMDDYDATAMGDLLTRQAQNLPRRDQVRAAQELGWNTQAITLAWKGLENNPQDAQLARQFRDLALAQADSVEFFPGISINSGLLTSSAQGATRLWLDPENRLEIEMRKWYQSSSDPGLIGPPPAFPWSVGLDWRHLWRLTSIDLGLGMGRNIAGWQRLTLDWSQHRSGASQTTLRFFYGARPQATAALEVGGLKDGARLEWTRQWAPRDTLQVSLFGERYRAQGGGYLGDAQGVSITAHRRLWFAPPSWSVQLSLESIRYQHGTNLPVQLDTLVPSGQRPTPSFFVPPGFVQACAGVQSNLHYQNEYSSRWHPYGAVSLCANSVIGGGYMLTLGMATPLMGPDHLALTLNLQNNVNNTQSMNARLVLNYRHYFQ